MPVIDTSWDVQTTFDYDFQAFPSRVLRVTVGTAKIPVSLYGEIMASSLPLVDYDEGGFFEVQERLNRYIIGILSLGPTARRINSAQRAQRARERAAFEISNAIRIPLMESPPSAWATLQGLLSQGGAATAAMVTADGELPKFLVLYGAYAIVMSVEPLRSAAIESVASRIRRWIDPEGQAAGRPSVQQSDAQGVDAPPESPTT